MSDGDRHSIAAEPSLVTDPIEEAKRESENALAQFDRVLDMIDDVTRGGRPFRLRMSMILDLHRLALDGLSPYAGSTRPADVTIGLSKHTPPKSPIQKPVTGLKAAQFCGIAFGSRRYLPKLSSFRSSVPSPWRGGDNGPAKRKCARPPNAGATARTPLRCRSA